MQFNNTQPLYKTIADDLSRSIEKNIYLNGEKFPTEEKLCKKYNVSRVTIRQAINLLVEKEYIKKIQGSGSHVIYSEKSTTINRSSKIIPFSEEMRLLGKNPAAQVRAFQLLTASRQLAQDLEIPENESVFYYERILLADNYPYIYEYSYLPTRYFDDFSMSIILGSKIKYIEEKHNCKIDYSHQAVHAILAEEKVSELLQVPIGAPLLEVTHITYDMMGRAVEKTVNIFDSNLYQAHFTKKREASQ